MAAPPPSPQVKSVKFTLRDPVPLTLPGPKSGHVIRSNCHVTELNPYSRTVTYISFRNYYSHTLSVKYLPQEKALSQPESWCYCLKNYVLMKSGPHSETGGQDWFNIEINLSDVERLRLILRQPSSNWEQFHISDIQLYCKVYSHSAETDTHSAEIDTCSAETDTHSDSMEIVEKMLEITRRLSENN
ncbi:PREDICTED: uncharacterized protein LOC105316798 [Amphimedon queenslandica]|uniref:Nicolin-1 n=1 Tax=Amphimedon queenslandica TaxID=400682 RepID=A0A1X7VI24_AMPQE|nr:PREDICTED: uncharacterized protein LOC105316798 [Amphimedon queenslandica]|eukprot:XP_011410300.1 PREDICTED: uncharacterized protein LOC105316798 [Amphimedon queenslandica]